MAIKVEFGNDAFVAGLKRWQAANKLSNDQAALSLALNMAENIIRATPVDTGWARANWYPAINSKPVPPNTGVANPNAEHETTAGLKGKAKTDALKTAGDTGAQKSLDRTAEVFAGGRAGDVFTLANGVPYILALEHGHSKQAPNGMVTKTIAMMRSFLVNFKYGQ